MTTTTTSTTRRSLGSTTAGAGSGRVWYPLDGVRGLAALVVVLYHAYQNQLAVALAPGETAGGVGDLLFVLGESAVMLFFVISGFLLYLPLVKRVERGDPSGSPVDLIARRFARLYPLYAMTVLVVWGVANPSITPNWRDLVLHLTFTQVYSDRYIFWTIGPAWSLAVEFHFYLLLALLTPVVGRLAGRLRHRAARAGAVAFPALALLVGGSAYLAQRATSPAVAVDDWSLWFGPLVMVPFFALGMLLAVVAGHGLVIRRATVRAALTVLGVAGLAWLAARHHIVVDTRDYLGRLWLLPVTGLLMAGLVLAPAGANRWLDRRSMVALGGLSYGIYLLHEPVLRLCRWAGVLPERDGQQIDLFWTFAMVAPLAVAAAWLSSRFIEPNGMRIGALLDRRGRSREYYPHLVEESKS